MDSSTPSTGSSSVFASNTIDYVYPSGILFATFSFLVMLLIIPPLVWHFRNRNIGAAALISWTIFLLIFNFVNAILWPTDDIFTWYNGVGLCDVEVKIQVASQVGIPASFASILSALAVIMDPERATVMQTKAMRHRAYAIDLVWCIGLPSLQMPFQYIVQPHRYGISTISGCRVLVDQSWLTQLLIILPPLAWVLISAYFALLVLIRLYRYRLSFSSILATRNTTRSRFLRLYLICLTWIICAVPLEFLIFFKNADTAWDSFSWSEVHSAKKWREIILMQSHGEISYDRAIALSVGVAIFIFFGLGKDAINMYRVGLLAVGLGRIFPCLHSEYIGTTAVVPSGVNGKIRKMFRRDGARTIPSRISELSSTSTCTESDSVAKKESLQLS